jgi:hypothetical protein
MVGDPQTTPKKNHVANFIGFVVCVLLAVFLMVTAIPLASNWMNFVDKWSKGFLS